MQPFLLPVNYLLGTSRKGSQPYSLFHFPLVQNLL
jgi:hypothetical protein